MSEKLQGCAMDDLYPYLMDPILLMDHTEEQQEEIGGRYVGFYFRRRAQFTKCLKKNRDLCCMAKKRRKEFVTWIPSTEEPYPETSS